MAWREQVAELLTASRAGLSRRQSLEEISSQLVGTPYCDNPLGGNPGETDPPAFALHCFDCVTFVEAVVALAISSRVDAYTGQILRLRYRETSTFWAERLHYFGLWLESNQTKGVVEILPPNRNHVIREMKNLCVVPGLPIIPMTVEAHPWNSKGAVARSSIIGFVSRSPDLDVFHVGILADSGRLLRHASRSSGQVVEEPLAGFLAREDGTGLLLARLRERGER